MSHREEAPRSRRATALTELERAVRHVREVPPSGAVVEAHRRRMLDHAAAHTDALVRSCLPGHFTASAAVVDHRGEQILLLHHTKLRRWLQPGGHVDGDGDLAVAARREASEETGLDGLTVFAPAIDLDIHRIPAHGAEPAHDHLDVRFIVRAPEGSVVAPNHESTDLRWFAFDDVSSLDVDAGLERMVEAARRATRARAKWSRRAGDSGILER